MKAILKNEADESVLLEEGYIVRPFLHEEEIADLKKLYFSRFPATNEGMYATAHDPNIDVRMEMNNGINQVFKRAINEHFVNVHPLGGSFIAKGKSQKGILVPHQDWNIVDEDRFRSFNIWVPLVDLSPENGTIRVLPRSHTLVKSYRSANIPSLFGPVDDVLWKLLIPLNMKAGEALIYDHRLLHASGENSSSDLRLAAVYGIIPDEAHMFYYHGLDEQTVQVFESNPEHFLYGNIFEGPVGKLRPLHTIPYSNTKTRSELLALVGMPNDAPSPSSWVDKLKRLFGV